MAGAWSAAARAWQQRPSPIRWRTACCAWPRRPRRRATGEAGRSLRQAYAVASRVGAAPIAQEAAALARRTRLILDEPDSGTAARHPRTRWPGSA